MPQACAGGAPPIGFSTLFYQLSDCSGPSFNVLPSAYTGVCLGDPSIDKLSATSAAMSVTNGTMTSAAITIYNAATTSAGAAMLACQALQVNGSCWPRAHVTL